MQAICRAALEETVRAVSQAAVIWASRAECPACVCSPAFTCTPSSATATWSVPGGCPSRGGSVSLLFAFAVGVIAGAAGFSAFRSWCHGGFAVKEDVSSLARQQVALVRRRIAD